MPTPIKKILIANRGEIAVRIIRTCKEMGIATVAVFSEADKTAHHVRLADEAFHIGPALSSESYLVQEKIIKTAKGCNATAIHPGYGFLAENADFAKLCIRNNIIFIGPNPETIALLGDKLQARRTAIEAKLPIVPGSEIEKLSIAKINKLADEVGYPVLIKATAGGGGKGMRVVKESSDLENAIVRAKSEALSSFGDDRVYLEKYIEHPRHIEIQILCDSHGNAVHLGERECSIQRRHQKLIEETPSPFVTVELRDKMTNAALSIAKSTNYVGAGTVEFIVDSSGGFYFLEVNTRLQVEHPVTEMVTGLDLVREQIRIAEGKQLSFTQADIKFNGHSIEFRICAEDPDNSFMPSIGTLKNYRPPSGAGIRVDSGVLIFSEVSVYYDSLICKLIVWATDRKEAIAKGLRALEEFRISGVKTTIGIHSEILETDKFQSGDISTDFLENHFTHDNVTTDKSTVEIAAVALAIDKFLSTERTRVNINMSKHTKPENWKLTYRQNHLNRTKNI